MNLTEHELEHLALQVRKTLLLVDEQQGRHLLTKTRVVLARLVAIEQTAKDLRRQQTEHLQGLLVANRSASWCDGLARKHAHQAHARIALAHDVDTQQRHGLARRARQRDPAVLERLGNLERLLGHGKVGLRTTLQHELRDRVLAVTHIVNVHHDGRHHGRRVELERNVRHLAVLEVRLPERVSRAIGQAANHRHHGRHRHLCLARDLAQLTQLGLDRRRGTLGAVADDAVACAAGTGVFARFVA